MMHLCITQRTYWTLWSADCFACASVKHSLRTTVRVPRAADFRDLNLGPARSLHEDLKWRGVHLNGRAVVKD